MRTLGLLLILVGGVVALGSITMGLLAVGFASTIVWIAPEIAGLILLVVGLHAWIEG